LLLEIRVFFPDDQSNLFNILNSWNHYNVDGKQIILKSKKEVHEPWDQNVSCWTNLLLFTDIAFSFELKHSISSYDFDSSSQIQYHHMTLIPAPNCKSMCGTGASCLVAAGLNLTSTSTFLCSGLLFCYYLSIMHAMQERLI
jgi:hypothetical protein